MTENQTDAQIAANALSPASIEKALEYPQTPEDEKALREALQNKTR